MGNQQAKVTDLEYGWVAGFFDAEGSVLINVRAKAGKNLGPKVQPACKIQATDQPSLEKLTAILSRAEIAHHVAWTQPKGQDGRLYRPAWAVTMAGLRRTARFLEWITPALATKRQRAELAMEYIQKRFAHSDFRTPITDDEMEIVQTMRVLNASKKPVTVQLNRETPGASSEKLSINGRKGATAKWGVRECLND